MRRVLLALWLLCPLPASAAEPTPPAFGMPVDCRAVGGCFIQNYTDTMPGPEHADYRCGPLTYPDHDGTDFRLRNLQEMARGIPVLAVAAGTVKGLRDGEPNADAGTPGQREKIGNRECGNGVLIAHQGGWESQYCHMQAGSIKVRTGQTVAKGEPLGTIGLSGLTEFPHLHLAIRHHGQPLDPFTGNPVPKKGASSNPLAPDCLASLDKSLWDADARAQLGYLPTALLGSGFATSAPDVQEVRQGKARLKQFDDAANMLIFWTEVAGVRQGDKAVMLITAPDGTVVASHEDAFDRNRAAQFRYIGLKRPPIGWPKGEFTGIYRLLRGKETVATVREKIRHD